MLVFYISVPRAENIAGLILSQKKKKIIKNHANVLKNQQESSLNMS